MAETAEQSQIMYSDLVRHLEQVQTHRDEMYRTYALQLNRTYSSNSTAGDTDDIQTPEEYALAPRRFLVCATLRRLARRMRHCGVDTFYFASHSLSESVNTAVREKRVFVCRNRQIFQMRKSSSLVFVCLRTDDTEAQAQELSRLFQLNLSSDLPPDSVSRCIACNFDSFERVNKEGFHCVSYLVVVHVCMYQTFLIASRVRPVPHMSTTSNVVAVVSSIGSEKIVIFTFLHPCSLNQISNGEMFNIQLKEM